jgi:glycosyltransferase 2 family protein
MSQFRTMRAAPQRRWLPRALLWLPGATLFVLLVLVVTQLGEGEHFVRLMRNARPSCLLAAVGLQAITYLCSAGIWQRLFERSHAPTPPLRTLTSLSLARFYTDRTMPSGGLGGAEVLTRGLERRGVPAPLATSALIFDLATHYAAYVTVVALSLLVLWSHCYVNRGILALAALFTILSVGAPLSLAWMHNRGARAAPAVLRKMPGLMRLIDAVARVPMGFMRDPALFAEGALLQLAIFVLDAATLYLCLGALGLQPNVGLVFASFVMASVAATLSLLPGGLGSFEWAALAMLGLLGVPVETAFLGTLLLRGMTFWLPLVPGFLASRHEMHAGRFARA